MNIVWTPQNCCNSQILFNSALLATYAKYVNKNTIIVYDSDINIPNCKFDAQYILETSDIIFIFTCDINSIYMFYDLYVSQLCPYDAFCDKLFNICSDIIYNDVYCGDILKNNATIYIDHSDMTENEVNYYNASTVHLIDKFIEMHDDCSLCFVCDDSDVKYKYQHKYSTVKQIEHTCKNTLDIMSKSIYIIISTKTSKYSIFPCLKNKTKLSYICDEYVNINKYNDEHKFVKYYKHKIGLLLFHQCYTDIINCLGMINYYMFLYNRIILLIRNDVKPLIDYFISCLPHKNIELCYDDNALLSNYSFLPQKYGQFMSHPHVECLFSCYYDIFRTGQYARAFEFRYPKLFFVERFYISYDITYNCRIEYFEYRRNETMENELFKITNNEKYVLIHEDTERNVIIDKTYITQNYKLINLDKISYLFYDAIKLIENAEEIHLIDSCWACFIYLLCAKNKNLYSKKIFIHCKREYQDMFNKPLLDNLSLI